MERLLLLIVLVLSLPSSFASEPLRLGWDWPYRYYEDKEAALTLEQFLRTPDTYLENGDGVRSFGYTRSVFWIKFTLPADLFQQEERWLVLEPAFIDRLTLFYRPVGTGQAWSRREAGDLGPAPRGDADYRFPVFQLAKPVQEAGYEVIVRLESSSAVLIKASLWESSALMRQASKDSAFWGFYFGLAAVSSLLALILALVLKSRLFWVIFLFSLNFVLVACVQGFIGWLWGAPGLLLQHYLTSILTLVAYAGLLWLCIEVLDIKRHFPRAYVVFMTVIVANLLLLASIPLDLYSFAIKLQGGLLVPTALMFVVGNVLAWSREKRHFLYLLIGMSPFIYLVCAMLTLASLHGLISFYNEIYISWQYMLLINMGLVLWLAIKGILDEHSRAREKQQVEHELRVVRESSFNQRQFMGIVSHEFRTPLSIIDNAVQNLQLFTRSQPFNHRLNKIKKATDRLVQLTDNCLVDARLDASSLAVQATSIDFGKLLEEVCNQVDLYSQHELHLMFNGECLKQHDSIPHIDIVADRGLLRIVLANLIDNAIKYSPPGVISLDITYTGDQLIMGVADQGEGISSEQAEFIFERYRRIDSPSGKYKAGTGLGLHVARQIALAHGGDLKLTTYKPDSCRFELTLPNKIYLT